MDQDRLEQFLSNFIPQNQGVLRDQSSLGKPGAKKTKSDQMRLKEKLFFLLSTDFYKCAHYATIARIE